MRRALLAALPLLVVPLFVRADRAARPVTLTRTGVSPADGRVVATPKGFAAAVKDKGGCLIVEYDGTGRNLRQISFTDREPSGWWLSHDAETVAVVRDGKLSIEGSLHEGIERIDQEPAPSGDVVFSVDDRRIAFLAGGRVVVRERSKDGKRVEIPVRKNRAVFEGPLFSGDGKRVLVVTGPVDGDAPDSPVGSPDRIEECDPAAGKPVWLEVHAVDGGPIRGLRASGGTSRVVFILPKDGKQALRVLDLADATFEDVAVWDGLGELAFPAGGETVLLTAKGRGGRMQGFLVETHRSGSMREFACDVVAAPENEDVSVPVVSGEAFFFLSRPTDAKDRSEILCSTTR